MASNRSLRPQAAQVVVYGRVGCPDGWQYRIRRAYLLSDLSKLSEADIALSNTMQTLDISLFRRFINYKTHIKTLYDLTNCSGITDIIFRSWKIRLHIVWMYPAHFMAQVFNFPGPIFRPYRIPCPRGKMADSQQYGITDALVRVWCNIGLLLALTL